MKKHTKTHYVNRELSWLKFNERVLEEANDESVPLCERLAYIKIFQNNLDEFFMVRVGMLYDQMLCKKQIYDSKTNMSSAKQVEEIIKRSRILGKMRDIAYKNIIKKLEEYDIYLYRFDKMTKGEKRQMESYFEREVLPLMSPMIVGRKQPFPFIKEREIYAIVLIETAKGKEKIGIVPCGNCMSERLIPICAMTHCYILLEELILHFISRIFHRYTIISKSLVKVTRNADINIEAMEDEDLNYLDNMKAIIKLRKKLSPVRLEVLKEYEGKLIELFCHQLGISKEQVFFCYAPLDLGFVPDIRELLKENQELFFKKHIPVWSNKLIKNRGILSQVKEKDILLSYPYESMQPFLRLLQEASLDESVVSIKMTLYRLARQSKIIESLIDAAENGKEVVVLLELKARFDEKNNIEWSQRLEEAGCRVIYGIDELKVHSKLCLITRKQAEGIEYITQIGTGNYNERTATIYTDLSFLTSNYEIGRDVAKIFNALCMGEMIFDTKHLLVAPQKLQSTLIAQIEKEIARAKEGKEAYIGIKVNSLTDLVLIDKLVEASINGVKIDMIVRGICCLLPKIVDITENIRIISIVGQFLEHSRIYIFGCHENERSYISSADWMTRNMKRRIEIAVPIYNTLIKQEIKMLFDTMMKDTIKARELKADGTYQKQENRNEKVNGQDILCKHYVT